MRTAKKSGTSDARATSWIVAKSIVMLIPSIGRLDGILQQRMLVTRGVVWAASH
jgi:hypothetical protein